MTMNKNLKKILISGMALLMMSSVGTLTSSKLVSAKHINSARIKPNYYKSGQKLASKSMLLSLVSADPKRERKNLAILANNKNINNYSFDLGFLQSISSHDSKLIKHNKISDPYYTKMVDNMHAYYMVKASQAYKKANNHNKKVIMNVICGDETKGITKYNTKNNLRIFNRLTHSNFNEYEKAASGSDLLGMAEDSTDSASLPHKMVKHNMAKAKRMKQKGYRLLNQVKPYYNKVINKVNKLNIINKKITKNYKHKKSSSKHLTPHYSSSKLGYAFISNKQLQNGNSKSLLKYMRIWSHNPTFIKGFKKGMLNKLNKSNPQYPINNKSYDTTPRQSANLIYNSLNHFYLNNSHDSKFNKASYNYGWNDANSNNDDPISESQQLKHHKSYMNRKYNQGFDDRTIYDNAENFEHTSKQNMSDLLKANYDSANGNIKQALNLEDKAVTNNANNIG